MTLKGDEVGQKEGGPTLLVTISLPWKRVTLTELAQLELQQILPPDVSFSGGVVVSIEGHTVARGDLVKLDGELAVRINTLHGVDL